MGNEIYAKCEKCLTAYSVLPEHLQNVQCPTCGGKIIPAINKDRRDEKQASEKYDDFKPSRSSSGMTTFMSGKLLEIPFRKLHENLPVKPIESTVKWIELWGNALLPSAVILALILGMKLKRLDLAIFFAVITIALQYFSVKFQEISKNIISDSSIVIFSEAVTESFAFLIFAAGLIYPAYRLYGDLSMLSVILAAVVFVSCTYISFLLMKPELLNIKYDKNSEHGETILSLCILNLKIMLKAAPLLSSIIYLGGTLSLLSLIFKPVKTGLEMEIILIASMASGVCICILVGLLIVPVITLLSLVTLCQVNMCTAILGLKTKKEKV